MADSVKERIRQAAHWYAKLSPERRNKRAGVPLIRDEYPDLSCVEAIDALKKATALIEEARDQ